MELYTKINKIIDIVIYLCFNRSTTHMEHGNVKDNDQWVLSYFEIASWYLTIFL